MWRYSPGSVLESREPCKEDGAIVTQKVAFDEVTEEQEETAEHYTWKIRRSTGTAAPW